MNTIQHYGEFLRADQAITSNITLQTVTGFSAPMEANRAYGFQAELQVNLAGVLSGIKAAVTIPASPANAAYKIEVINGTGLSVALLGISGAVAGALAQTGLHLVKINGIIENGGNAGNLAIQIAQNVSDGSALTIKRGSWLTVWNLT